MERLVAPVNDHEKRLVQAIGVVIEKTEQPVMMAAGTVRPCLEPSGHGTVHGLPRPTAGETLGRGRGDGVQYRVELRPHPRRANLLEKLSSGHRLSIVIAEMAPKEHDVVRII